MLLTNTLCKILNDNIKMCIKFFLKFYNIGCNVLMVYAYLIGNGRLCWSPKI